MAREWQPESRTERQTPREASPRPATGGARGPGGTTGWVREQDFRGRSDGPAPGAVDPEAETRHRPVVALQEERPGPGPEEPQAEAPERNGGGNPAAASAAEEAGAPPIEEPDTEPPISARPDDPREGSEPPAAATPSEGSRWQRFIGRSTGGGPLSAGRVAREQARQTPPGGKNPERGPAAGGGENGREASPVEPGGTMDPNTRMQRIAEQISRGDRDPNTAEAYGDEEEEEAAREGLARGGPLVWLIDHWKLIALPLGALCMLTFVLATVGLPDLGGGQEVASTRGAPGEPSGQGAAGSPGVRGTDAAPLYDSGLSFSFAEKDDGTVEISAGEDLTWTGRLERISKQESTADTSGEDATQGESSGSAAMAAVEVLRLSGPTAAEVGPGYVMDSGSENAGQKSTTVFAVEGEGVPDVHATFDLFTGVSGEGATERANGSYDVTADSGELIAEGSYSDHRTGDFGGREVIRTYTEQVPGESGSRVFRVRYEADEGMPIPLLAGWQTPEERPEDLKLGGQS